ncbi:MAG TPA: ABC transporter permease [Devosia sp.]|nr:ABC transporter permease [Devosia sp.]
MTGPGPQAKLRDARSLAQKHALLLVFFGFIIVAGTISGGRFLAPSNLAVILFQTSVVGVLVLGQVMVMLVAGIDLSIAAVAILAAVAMGAASSERQIMMNLGGFLPFLGLWPAIAIAFAGAILVGVVNGLMVVLLRIPAFIATLAMSLALMGVATLATGGGPVNYPDRFFPDFGFQRILGLPLPVYLFLALALIVGFALARTSFGTRLYAIGGNPRAARLSGIPVRTVTVLAYTLCALLGAVAGFLFLARTGVVTPGSGSGLLLTTIASAVVGGVNLYGGKGSIFNAVIGTLLLAGLSNLMNIMLVSPHLQSAVSGLIIVAAIMLNARLDQE